MEFSAILGWITAIGIGLLIGLERERHKGRGSTRKQAGLRSFLLVSLTGAIGMQLGPAALVVAILAVGALAVVSYWRTRGTDPGITTEMALVATLLLGALAMRDSAFAAALAVFIAIALAGKVPLHHFVRRVLSAQEVNDGLLLAAAVLIVLPLLPDHPLAILGGLNPRTLWLLAILVMGIQTLGHVFLRVLGPSHGLALAGLAGGFISSVATIAAMGQRARTEPVRFAASLAGAYMSNIATVLQLALLVGILMPALLLRLAPSLVLAGLVALVSALWTHWRSRSRQYTARPVAPSARLFSPREALIFAVLVGGLLWIADTAGRAAGAGALVLTATLAGFADTHAAAASVAQLALNGELPQTFALVAILSAFSSNAISKMLAALVSGGWRFALSFAAVAVVMMVAAWGGLLWLWF
ncbi:MAG: MgtC/SapB family protein [Gammaproteobacteria bacterium]|nr:MgtC/SapB family protein [Gammaproteobacteria bacterium]